MSATASAFDFVPVEIPEVVRCDFCSLVQYRTTNSLCRKCRRPLDVEEIKPVPLPALEVEPQTLPPTGMLVGLAKVFRQRRLRLHLTQKQIAKPESPRTHIAKLEAGTIPNFSTFQRYARKLRTRGSSLLAMIEDPKTKPLGPLECLDKAVLMYTGPVLRRLRDESEKNKAEFLLAIGTTSPILWRWETGKGLPSLPYLERFASAIDMPLSALVAEIENAACLGG